MGRYSVCTIGAGYVGAITSIILAQKNPDVDFTVVDSDSAKIDAWNSNGPPPIHEPGLETRRDLRNLLFSSDIKRGLNEAEMIFVCVNTPAATHAGDDSVEKRPVLDLRSISACVETIRDVCSRTATIVLRSTIPPDTAEGVYDRLNSSPGASFTVLSNPELLAQGTAVSNFLHPECVVIGCSSGRPQGSETALQSLYRAWLPESRILVMSHSSASLFKLTSNALLAQRVSTVNCLAMICDRLNEAEPRRGDTSSPRADITDISCALSMSSKLGQSIWYQPGIGFGGSCLPKDTVALAAVCDNLGLPTTVGDLFRTAFSVNHIQIENSVQRILEILLDRGGRPTKVVVWGYAYKPGTGDPRESAARAIATHLLGADVEVHIQDPNMTVARMHADLKAYMRDDFDRRKQAGKLFLHPYEAFGDLYDLTNGVIVTNAEEMFLNVTCERWEEIFRRMSAPKLVFDGRNCLDSAMLKDIGFTVVQVGR